MKAIKNTLVLATITLGMLFAQASEKLNKGDKISVTDITGEIIYSGSANIDGELTRLFDFSQLNDGKYTVDIIKDSEIKTTTVLVNNSKVTLLENSGKIVFKPVFKTNDTSVTITSLAFDTDVIMTKLYYNGTLIYSGSTKGNNSDIKKIYQLDKTQSGDYSAVVTINGHTFVERFTI